MPRKSSDARSEMNKTQIIREHLARNPDAMPKPLAEELQKLGYDVKPQHVSTVKFHMKREVGGGAGMAPGEAAVANQMGSALSERSAPRRKPGRKKRGRKPRSAQAGSAAPARGDMSFESLRRAKEMADQLGGVARAKQALDALAQLVG